MITIVVQQVQLKITSYSTSDDGELTESSAGEVFIKLLTNADHDTKSSFRSALSSIGWGCFGDPADGWGKMYVKLGKLEKSERRRSFRHRPSFVGPFRYSHRALIPISDGRAWHHRAISQGGTVLIDKSGSMDISEPEIIDFLHKRPLATVAIYEGSNGNCEGTLTIIAKENRYATMIPTYDGGNVVDGPALRWLARQQKPRVWVCDGGITGVADKTASQSMKVEAAITIKRADIKQVKFLSEAIKVV